MRMLGIMMAGVMAASSAYAEDIVAAPIVEEQYIAVKSGGIGKDEREEIAAVQGKYSVKFTFAGKNGRYLADVDVTIRNMEGNEVVSTRADGPVLLVDLPTGKYMATVAVGEETQEIALSALNGQHHAYVVRFENIEN